MAKKISAVFFLNSQGGSPVQDWLRSLEKEIRVAVGRKIGLVEINWPDVKMPLVKSLSNGLFEVRISFGSGIARVFFFVEGSKMILLHGIIKKTQKTPVTDLELARKRMKEYEG